LNIQVVLTQTHGCGKIKFIAVVIQKNSTNASHVPQELYSFCWYFLQQSGSRMTGIISATVDN